MKQRLFVKNNQTFTLLKQNAKTKRKREGKEDINNKETKNEKKIVDNDLYNKLSMLMDGMNNKKKKKK